eukprot:Em0554g5a
MRILLEDRKAHEEQYEAQQAQMREQMQRQREKDELEQAQRREQMKRQRERDELEKNQMREQMEMLRRVVESRASTRGTENETDGRRSQVSKAHGTR